MSKFLLAMALATLSLTATDATGKWTGILLLQGGTDDGTSKPAFFVLKQEGAKLIGTAGPSESEQFEIQEGKAEGGRLTFKVPQHSLTFDLKQDGDELSGEATREHDGEMQKAKITAKRQP